MLVNVYTLGMINISILTRNLKACQIPNRRVGVGAKCYHMLEYVDNLKMIDYPNFFLDFL